MILAQDSGILGIFPVFYSLTTTHLLLSYWKDHGGEQLRKILFTPSPELKSHLLEMNFEGIIPIPQHLDRSLKRGHASAFEVAKFFSKELEVPLHENYLQLKSEFGAKQASLNEWERRHGENPFAINTKLPFLRKGTVGLPEPEVKTGSIITAKKILLIDDFITTGSTLQKAANLILLTNPSAKIFAASLGYRPRRSSKS